MTDELVKLIKMFCEHGGVFENMTVGYRHESGFNCSVIDSHHTSTVFCPTNLLVDVDDIGVREDGLFIAKPENYANNIVFLERYFSFHFGKKVVERLLEEKRQIDSISEHEEMLLKRINLPDVIDGEDQKLEYVKYRIFQSHQITFDPLGKKVIMPFVTFLNHDLNGAAYDISRKGITVSGRFDGEVLAHYQMGDVVMFLRSYGFVADTMFAYSLPMHIQFPNGISIQINNDISKFKKIDGNLRWPVVEDKDGVITVSWFPMYFKGDPSYPSRFVTSLTQEFNIPAEYIIYPVFRLNLQALLPIVFSLKDSENSYIQMVVSGVERQLELIGGI